MAGPGTRPAPADIWRDDFRRLSEHMLRYANQGGPRIDFLRELSGVFFESSGCDEVELRLNQDELYYRWIATALPAPQFEFRRLYEDERTWSDSNEWPSGDDSLEELCRLVAERAGAGHPQFTRRGSFFTSDASRPILIPSQTTGTTDLTVRLRGPYRSRVIIPFTLDAYSLGLLQLKSKSVDFFGIEQVEFNEALAQTAGLAIVDRRTQAALRERIKELTCLYGIALLTTRPNISLDELLQGVVELLPPAWQFPRIACARIEIDGREYRTARFEEALYTQSASISVGRTVRGVVEIRYCQERPEFAEGPFLKEEKDLIDTVAKQLAAIVDHRQAELEKSRLRLQLQHAERLATIGQLAAGVAHELNEPLGNILGFAQLALKSMDNPAQARSDLDRIVTASLHAREVIRKLMLFARQKLPHKSRLDLNQLVCDALGFLESRCAQAGVNLIRLLADDLPEVVADPTQINQILVNLAVNAIQAMPNGGTLTVETDSTDEHVIIVVEDTGMGMTEEVKSKIFVPFFTTKDVGQGTGLGLSVVHGIVSAHGGSISVFSHPNEGTRFEIRLPQADRTTDEDKVHAEP